MSDPVLTLHYEFARKKTLVASIGPTLSISRAGNASRVNGAGLIETVAANTARFDFDPATKASLGLLIEEARTNLVLQSSDVVTAPWGSIQTPVLVINDAISPRGTLEATLITDNNATNREGVQQSVVVPNNSATHATSIFVKKTTGGTSPTFGLEMVYAGGTGTVPVQIRLNTDTGETNGVGGGAAQDYGDYWRLWGISTNNASGNTTLLIKLLPATAANGSFVDVMSTTGSAHAWGCQAEIGSTPTSYIETFGVVVIRDGDIVSTTDLSWLNPLEGAFFTDTIVPIIAETGTGTPAIFSVSDGTNTNRILHTYDREPGFYRTFVFMTGAGNVQNVNDTAISLVHRDRLRMATSWKDTTLAATSNGNAVLENLSVTIPTGLNLLNFSSVLDTVQANGHMRELRYYNVRKDNQFLEDLSSGLINEVNDLAFSRNLARPLERPLANTMR